MEVKGEKYMGVHWKIRILGKVDKKPIYRGGIA